MKFLDDPFEKSALVQARAREERAQVNAHTFKNIFSIPLGTVNPDRFITRAYPLVAFMFQPFFVVLGIGLFVLSGYVVWLNQDHIVSGASNVLLSGGHRVLGAFLLWLVVTLAIIVHELGHGFCLKHHGGTVNRLGFIFIFGLPCMFCDISDTHMFPNWKHRAQVALAGTYTELYVATLATLVWWLTPSDLLVNQLAFNVMLFASVSGILFNYNPLIKTDGYFVLSDLLDMSNLQEDAFGYLGYLFKRYALGLRAECPIRGRRRKRILALYGALSILYSALFTFLVYRLFRGYLIQTFAFAGALTALGLLLIVLRKPIVPLGRALRLWALEHRLGLRGRLAPGLALALLAAAAVFLAPLPGSRAIEVTLEPARIEALVAPEKLRLKSARFQAGERVARGDVIAVLDADSMAIVREGAEARATAARVAGAGARLRRDAAGAALERVRAAGETGQSEVLARRLARAELRAPFAATVLSAGIPALAGERLAPGDTVCVLGDFSAVRASAWVSEFDLDDVRLGAAVRVRLRVQPGHVLHGRVAAVDVHPESVTIRGQSVPRFRVWISLRDRPAEPRAGLTGRARISTPRHTLAALIGRWAARFIRADLWV
jgi:putative peptide zinc metalloprotease protein